MSKKSEMNVKKLPRIIGIKESLQESMEREFEEEKNEKSEHKLCKSQKDIL